MAYRRIIMAILISIFSVMTFKNGLALDKFDNGIIGGFVWSADELAGYDKSVREGTPKGQIAVLGWCVCKDDRKRIAMAYFYTNPRQEAGKEIADPAPVTEVLERITSRYGGCFTAPSVSALIPPKKVAVTPRTHYFSIWSWGQKPPIDSQMWQIPTTPE